MLFIQFCRTSIYHILKSFVYLNCDSPEAAASFLVLATSMLYFEVYFEEQQLKTLTIGEVQAILSSS